MNAHDLLFVISGLLFVIGMPAFVVSTIVLSYLPGKRSDHPRNKPFDWFKGTPISGKAKRQHHNKLEVTSWQLKAMLR